MKTTFGMVGLACGLASCVAWAAGNKVAPPNHSNPEGALAVQGDQQAEALRGECQSRYETAAKAIREFREKERQNQLGSIEAKRIGTTAVALAQLDRLAERLQLLGEPAGWDFNLRTKSLRETLKGIVFKYRLVPEAQKPLQQIRRAVSNAAKQRETTAKKIQKLISDGDWESAETQLYAALDKLREITTFLTPDEMQGILTPFEAPQRAIENNRRMARQEAAGRSLAARLASQAPDLDQLLQEIAAATESVKATGTGKIGEQSKTGPELIQHFLGRWRQIHVAIVRYRGLFWATSSRAAALVGNSAGQTTDAVLTRYDGFPAEISAALAGLIDADAPRVSPADAPALYVEYVRAAASAVSSTQPADPAKPNPYTATLAPALSRLAERSTAFLKNVEAYDAATGELLRWKKRTAASLAAARSQQFVAAERQFQLLATANVAQQRRGFFHESEPAYPDALLLYSVPESFPGIADDLLGKTVSVLDVTPLGNGKTAMSRRQERTYATFPAIPSTALQAAAQSLAQDLFSEDPSAPLTLAAAAALEDARRGNFKVVGGEVTGVHLETLLVRAATLPDAAWPLEPLSALAQPVTNGGLTQLARVLVRLDLQPAWAQHECFLVEVP